MKLQPVTRAYYPALDGLRGIAIISVLFCHNFIFLSFSKFGWAGVDLFFVLSGFLITEILLQTRENKDYLKGFYIRRVLRIFPLYYGMLLIVLVIFPFLSQFKQQHVYYMQNQGALWFHLQNWLVIFRQQPNYMPLSHFWSLSVEEQFYLIWPFIILFFKNLRKLVFFTCCILAACILFRFFCWLHFGNGDTTYQLQYKTRIDGLCIGSLIAIWRFNGANIVRKNLMKLSTILLSIHIIAYILVKTIFIGTPHFSFFGYTDIAVLFGFIMLYAIEKRNAGTKLLLENQFVKGLGKISYGLYVYHWPVLLLFKIYLLPYSISLGLSNQTAYISVPVAAAAMSIAISIASYNLFERKILALKDVITSEGFFTRFRLRIHILLKTASLK